MIFYTYKINYSKIGLVTVLFKSDKIYKQFEILINDKLKFDSIYNCNLFFDNFIICMIIKVY